MIKKHYLLVLAVAGAMLMGVQSCKSGSKNAKQQAETEQMVADVLQIDELLTGSETLAGQQVEIEGVCTHICKHGGGKIFLMGSDDTKTIRIEAGEKVGKFAPETVNSVVRVKGKLMEDRIDEAYLTAWEERLKNQTAEKHGNGEAGCASEQKAQGEAATNSQEQRIENFRKRIAERNEKEGKNYLSFYHVDADSYDIHD